MRTLSRRRRRALGAVLAPVAAVLLAACSGSGGHHALASTTTTVPPVSSTASTTPPVSAPSTVAATSTTAIARCTTVGLALRSNGGSAATGHALAVFELRNTTSTACRLAGYPGVKVLGPSGAALTDAQRVPGFILGDAPATAVTVAAGQAAYFGVESANVCQGGGDPVPSASLAVTPPDETAALTVAATINVCPGASSVLVSPVRAAAADIPRH
jgi:hypothetical protein